MISEAELIEMRRNADKLLNRYMDQNGEWNGLYPEAPRLSEDLDRLLAELRRGSFEAGFQVGYQHAMADYDVLPREKAG